MKKIYFIIILSCHILFSTSAQISFVSENFYREISSEGDYLLIKHGFDVNFYTPLVENLAGDIENCTIEEYLPVEEINKLMRIEREKAEYNIQKTKYNAQKKSYKKKHPFLLITPSDYPGYDIQSFVYEIDSSNRPTSISLLEVRLMDLDVRKIRSPLSLYQIRWEGNINPILFYQAPSWKDRNLNSILLSYVEEEKYDGYKKHNILFQKLKTDSLADYKLKVISKEETWHTDTANQLMNLPEMRRIYHTDNSIADYGFYMDGNDTIPVFSKKFNPEGLLVQQIFYTRFFYKMGNNDPEDIETINYKYDDKLPYKVSYQKGNNSPIEYMLKFTEPDSLNNLTKMEVYNGEQIINQVYWHINYRK